MFIFIFNHWSFAYHCYHYLLFIISFWRRSFEKFLKSSRKFFGIQYVKQKAALFTVWLNAFLKPYFLTNPVPNLRPASQFHFVVSFSTKSPSLTLYLSWRTQSIEGNARKEFLLRSFSSFPVHLLATSFAPRLIYGFVALSAPSTTSKKKLGDGVTRVTRNRRDFCAGDIVACIVGACASGKVTAGLTPGAGRDGVIRNVRGYVSLKTI